MRFKVAYFFVYLSFLGQYTFAQNIIIDGRLSDIDSKKRLVGATVSVMEGSKVITSTTSASNGKYSLSVPQNKIYTVKYYKNGFVTKVMKIDLTGLNEEDVPIDGMVFPPIDIDLFMDRPNVDFSFLKDEPVVEWSWKESEFRMWYDEGKMKSVKDKIDAMLEDAEKQSQENEKKYNQLILEANNLFENKDLENSKEKYLEALKIPGKDKELLPNERLSEIDNLIKKIEQESLANEKLENEFNNLITSAEELFNAKNFEKALLKYKEAKALKPTDENVINRIEATNLLIQSTKKQSEVDLIIETADALFSQNKLEAAKLKYQSALNIDASNSHASAQLEIIAEKLLEKQELSNKKDKFDKLLTKADDYFKEEKYLEAKNIYEEALSLDNSSSYAQNKINSCDAKLAELEKINASNNEFEKLAKDGDLALDNFEFETAIQSYTEALKIKTDPFVTNQLQKAKDGKLKSESELKNRELLEQFINEGDQKMIDEDYNGALISYQAGINLDPSNLDLIRKKKDAENKLKISQNESKKKEQFTQLKAEADKYFFDNKFKEALGKYKAANDLIGGDTEVIEGIRISTEKLNEIQVKVENESKISKLIDEGAIALLKFKWDEAIDKYETVLAIDDQNKTAIEKIEYAKTQKKSEQENQQKLLEFENIKNEGDQLFAQQKYELAKEKYIESLEIIEDFSVQSKIKIIDVELSKIDEKYNAKLKLAQDAADNSDFKSAIVYLQDASVIKPKEALPKEKINEFKTKLDELNEINADDIEFNDFIRDADLQFANKNYFESKTLYEEALKIKEDKYASEQSIKCQLLLEIENNAKLKKDYEDQIEIADSYYLLQDYEEAIKAYEKALEIKNNDDYASNRIEKLQEILTNSENGNQFANQDKDKYEELIKEADALFDNGEYIKAKDKYEEALKLFPKDEYALNRVEESIKNSKDKAKESENIEYQKIIAKADEYFESENYEKAKGLYNRAIKFRSTDPYPQERIHEIQSILNPIKQVANLSSLGEEVDISIIDGAALMIDAEKQREQNKKQGILERIFANDKNVEIKTGDDWKERNEYNNEITFLKEQRQLLEFTNYNTERDIGEKVKVELENLNSSNIQLVNFEYGNLLRQSDEITYVLNDFQNLHDQNSTKHLAIADELYEISIEKENSERLIFSKEDDQLVNANEEILYIIQSRADDYQRSIMLKSTNDDLVRNLDITLDSKSEYEIADNYQKIQELKNDALISELKIKENYKGKDIIQFELEQDIMKLIGLHKEKNYSEVQELKSEYLEVDQLLTEANINYKKSYEESDDNRLESIEEIKLIEKENSLTTLNLLNKEKEDLKMNALEVESIKQIGEQNMTEMNEDLLAINEDINNQDKLFEQVVMLKNDMENVDIRKNVNEIESSLNNLNETTTESAEKAKNNGEIIKEIAESSEKDFSSKNEEKKNQRTETIELLNDLLFNKVEYTDAIANTLGDDFPEGVSQQVYVKNDKDGLPRQITTRRIVVKDKRGEVYVRIQSRNAVTYSKNGQAITEAAWNKDTENAKLVRHF